MARSVYGQLNQANIGQGIDTLLREIFEGDKEKYAVEASVIDSLSSTASSEAEFQKLDKVLDDYWKRNDMHGPIYEAKEIKQRADYSRRKDEHYKYIDAHNMAEGMLASNYMVSGTDKDGGIQNINTVDVAGWTHEKLTEELGKVNRIRDSFSLAKNGYHYTPKGNNTSLSLARDIDTYYKSLTAALKIAVETNEIPDDDILLRMIVSGDTEGVKTHSDEQAQKASERYKTHDSDLDTLEDLHDKIISYKNQSPQDFAQYLSDATTGKEQGNMIAGILSNIMGEEGFNMDYSVYAQNVGVAITDKIELRRQANERHKKYTGKLYEEVDESLRKKMEEYASQGSSYETQDELERQQREEQLKADEQAKQDSIKAREGLPDSTTSIAESTAVAITPTDTTTAPTDTTKDVGVKVEVPEEELSWYQKQQRQKTKERRGKQKQADKYNREQLAKTAQGKGFTEAPFDMYLDAIINDVTYEEYIGPEDKKERQAINNEITKSIKISNPNIDRLFNTLNPSGVKKDAFAKSIIKTWQALNKKAKFSHGSFSNFVDAIIEDFQTATDERDPQIQGIVR